MEIFTNEVEKEIPDILINAAGIYEEAQIVDENSNHWYSQLNIKLTGPFLMKRALMSGMIKKI
mgnify:CR=1 FL=1